MNQELQYFREQHLKLAQRMYAHEDRMDKTFDDLQTLIIIETKGEFVGAFYSLYRFVCRKFKKLKRKFEK